MHYNLKKLTIDNFRVFNKPTTIEFSPLTIFTGANNGGKSSVNKALNLLAKSHEDTGLSSLSLIGNQLNLGSFKSLINNKGKCDTISFCLEIQTAFVENADFKIEMSFKEWGLFKLKIYKNEILITSLTKESTNRNNTWFFTKNKDSYIKLPYTLINESALLNLFKELPPDMMEVMKRSILTHLENNSSCHENQEMYHFEDQLSKPDIISYCFDFFLSGINNLGKYSKKSANIVNEETGQVEDILYNMPISANPKFKDVLPEEILKIIPEESEEISISSILNLDSIKNYSPIPGDLLYTIFSSLNFTSGNRGFQQIIYTKENNPYIFNQLRDFDQKNGNYNQLSISMALVNIFGITDNGADEWDSQIIVSPVEDYGYTVRIGFKDSNHLSSLGYGMTQLIPIILNVSIHSGKIFIIEEPEANLHPSFQSKLADYFISSLGRRDGYSFLDIEEPIPTITYTNNFILETHSEYLIRKLQYLVAKGKAKSEDISIYYFQNNELKGDKVKRININRDGSLSDDFGSGFIDESDKIALDLLILRNSQTN